MVLQAASRPQAQGLLRLGRDQPSFAEKKLALKDKKADSSQASPLLRKLNCLLNL